MIVLVVSHVHFMRDALMQILRGNGDIDAVEACSCETLEAVVDKSPPNLIVVAAPHSEAAALVAAARARLPRVNVVVLADREQDEEFMVWAGIGISGYLGPDTSASTLMAAVRRVAAGDAVCGPRLAALLLSGSAGPSNPRGSRAGVHTLTSREHEIAALLADGLSNKLIARRLNVALATVKNHVHSILNKWDVHSRGEAAARASHIIQADGSPPHKGVVRCGSSLPSASATVY